MAGINKDDLQKSDMQGGGGWSNRMGRRNGVAVESERTKKAVIADESGV